VTAKKASFLSLSLLVLLTCPALALTPQETSEISNKVRTSSGRWMAEEAKARKHATGKRYGQAAIIYQEILKERTALGLDLQTEQLALADILEKQHQIDAAETIYKQAIAGREASEGDENLTLVYSLQAYSDFLARNKNTAAAATIKKRIAFINNQVGKAPKELTTLLKSAPAKTSAQYKTWAKESAVKAAQIGQLYLKRDQEPRAFIAFQKAIDLDATISDGYEGRGEVYKRSDQLTKAGLDFDKAIKLNPTNAQARLNRALSLRVKKNEKAALSDLNAAVAAAPEDLDILGYRAKLYQDTARPELAIKDYSHALKLNPAAEWARCQRGLCYMDAKNFDQAVSDFSALASKFPGDSNYLELKNKALKGIKPKTQ